MKKCNTVLDCIKRGISYRKYKKLNKNKHFGKKYWQAVKACVKSETSKKPKPNK